VVVLLLLLLLPVVVVSACVYLQQAQSEYFRQNITMNLKKKERSISLKMHSCILSIIQILSLVQAQFSFLLPEDQE
jgi:hypothetical protein